MLHPSCKCCHRVQAGCRCSANYAAHTSSGRVLWHSQTCAWHLQAASTNMAAAHELHHLIAAVTIWKHHACMLRLRTTTPISCCHLQATCKHAKTLCRHSCHISPDAAMAQDAAVACICKQPARPVRQSCNRPDHLTASTLLAGLVTSLKFYAHVSCTDLVPPDACAGIIVCRCNMTDAEACCSI